MLSIQEPKATVLTAVFRSLTDHKSYIHIPTMCFRYDCPHMVYNGECTLQRHDHRLIDVLDHNMADQSDWFTEIHPNVNLDSIPHELFAKVCSYLDPVWV